MTRACPQIWTIGHSTLDWDAFLELLVKNAVATLVDVRSFPGSRRYPQFNREAMARSLRSAGVSYVWMPELGGRRKPRADSKNTAWRNDAFRGYADYMETPSFEDGLENLEKLAREKPTAYMCSEAVWWRCHRGLISDALKIRGWDVLHITKAGTQKHPFTPAATVIGHRLSYAGGSSAPRSPVR